MAWVYLLIPKLILTLIPLIYVKPCFTGDVFIKHMYKGKGKNACLHDHYIKT